MFSISEFEYILNEYKEIHYEKMKNHKKLSVLLTILLVLVVFSLYGLGIQKEDPFDFLIPMYSGISLFLLLIYLSFSFGTGSSKAFYEFAVKKVIDKLNLNMDLGLQYSSNKKTDFSFNKKGGIFSRHCRSRVRMHIYGTSPHGVYFDLFELTLTTGSGNSQKTHLNGIYIVLENNLNTYQQVRTHGKPHLKGTEYTKLEEGYEYHVYLKEGLSQSSTNEGYINAFTRLMDGLEKQKGYLSVIENETHFALHPIKLYKYRKLSLDNLNIVYDKIKELIELVDKLNIEEF